MEPTGEEHGIHLKESSESSADSVFCSRSVQTCSSIRWDELSVDHRSWRLLCSSFLVLTCFLVFRTIKLRVSSYVLFMAPVDKNEEGTLCQLWGPNQGPTTGHGPGRHGLGVRLRARSSLYKQEAPHTVDTCAMELGR